MKRLSPERMVTIATAEIENIRRAESKLLPMLPAGCDENLFRRNVIEGVYSANQINIGDQPAFMVFWQIGWNQTLLIKGAVSLLDGEKRLQALSDGVDRIARAHSCTRISFHTFRAGLAKMAESIGYKAHSVCYLKILSV